MPARGIPVPPAVALAVRALIVARGAERAVGLTGLSPLALAALAAGAYAQPPTLRRARHYLEIGERLERPRPAPPPMPPTPDPEPLPCNVVAFRRPRRV